MGYSLWCYMYSIYVFLCVLYKFSVSINESTLSQHIYFHFRYQKKDIKVQQQGTCIVRNVPMTVHIPAHSGLFQMELLGRRMQLFPYNAEVTNLKF